MSFYEIYGDHNSTQPQQSPRNEDESQRILNDGVCAHELVMEKIRRLKAIIEDNSIGTHDNLVQVFLNLHKEISIVYEEISHWGEVIILFDQV